MVRVLVTGSSGFLGQAITFRLLDAGHDVLGLDPAPSPNAALLRRVDDDLSDRARLRGIFDDWRPAHVIHAGGISGPMVIPDQPMSIMATNVGGTLNLIEAAVQADVSTFVHCSSMSAIGSFEGVAPIGEKQPMRPDTPYGCSKAAAEYVLQGLWQRTPMELCALRFTGLYGPGRRTTFLLDDLVQAALERRPIRIPPTTPAPYLYVDDAANAVVAACVAQARKQLAYYVAHSELVGVEQLHKIVCEQVGPFDLTVDETLPAVRRGAADLAPTTRDLGFTARTDIRQGLKQLVAARRAAYPGGASPCRM